MWGPSISREDGHIEVHADWRSFVDETATKQPTRSAECLLDLQGELLLCVASCWPFVALNQIL